LVPAAGGLTASVTVTNAGSRDGEEVVQLYVSTQGTGAPVRSLKGFQRIFLKAGESRKIVFKLRSIDLSTLDEAGKALRLTGNIVITVGGCQPNAATLLSKQTVQATLRN
jgi:beta-glucosidase